MDFTEFIDYSSKEPMILLRKKFNNGEDIYKATPKTITAKEAMTDVMYTKYVFENAYSGYSYCKKDLFDNAFDRMIKLLQNSTELTPNQLIDLISSNLSFISDGHLALTTSDYGKGFYEKLQTYVSDMIVCKRGSSYYDVITGKQVRFKSPVRAFPTLCKGSEEGFLIGVRSKEPTEKITVKLGNDTEILSVHKILSEKDEKEVLVEERYEDGFAIIKCSSFVGDDEKLMKKLYEVGKNCRKYPHVVWDLSNNLGGNSEFPKHFLSGLYGDVADSVKIFELQSSLVCAKETGEIKSVSYGLMEIPHEPAKRRDLFKGELHVIINDRVASSAETAVCWAAACPNVTFYGCNSLGIGRFGDLCIYYLPKSQILLWLPQKVFDMGIRETVGFEPDYCIDSKNVVSSVLEKISAG